MLSFASASDANFLTFTTGVINNLTGNPYFAGAQSLAAQLVPASADFNKLLPDAKGGSRVQIEAKNVARAALTELLREGCRLVNVDANGDRLKLLTSGYAITSDYKKSAAPASVHALQAA
ncbi:MAG: hypothetical protein ACR2KZ_22650 [Segetibacter sp.]